MTELPALPTDPTRASRLLRRTEDGDWLTRCSSCNCDDQALYLVVSEGLCDLDPETGCASRYYDRGYPCCQEDENGRWNRRRTERARDICRSCVEALEIPDLRFVIL
jgi:hypothetical protein